MQQLVLPYALVLGLSLPWWLALSTATAAVPPGQVGRFARSYGLGLTEAGGNHLIAYLGTTRRWRVFGLATGVIVSIVSGLPALKVSSLPLFAGWFAGCLIAEWRILPPLTGRRRAALVAPRTLANYLPRFAQALVPSAIGLSVVIGLFFPGPALPWTIGAVAVGLTVLVMQRRVLRRPQPVVTPDVHAVDDAIRSRSLHVLAGGGGALVLFCVLGQLDRLGLDPAVGFAGFCLVSLVGWSVATRAR